MSQILPQALFKPRIAVPDGGRGKASTSITHKSAYAVVQVPRNVGTISHRDRLRHDKAPIRRARGPPSRRYGRSALAMASCRPALQPGFARDGPTKTLTDALLQRAPARNA